MFKVFLSYQYKKEIEEVAFQLKEFLYSLDCEVVDGKQIEPNRNLNQQVKNKIEQCSLLISFRTLETNSTYVIEESGFAEGKNIPVVILYEGSPIKGMLSDKYQLQLSKGLFLVAAEISEIIKQLKMKAGLKIEPTEMQNSPKAHIDNEGWTEGIKGKIYQIRECFTRGDIDNAYKLSSELIVQNGDCWRGYIQRGSCYFVFKNITAAEKDFQYVVDNFSSNKRALSYAYQNLAAIEDEKSSISGESTIDSVINYQKKALHFEPRLPLYIDIICNLFLVGKQPEAEELFIDCLEKYQEAKDEFKRKLSILGPKYFEQISKSKLFFTIVKPFN